MYLVSVSQAVYLCVHVSLYLCALCMYLVSVSQAVYLCVRVSVCLYVSVCSPRGEVSRTEDQYLFMEKVQAMSTVLFNEGRGGEGKPRHYPHNHYGTTDGQKIDALKQTRT